MPGMKTGEARIAETIVHAFQSDRLWQMNFKHLLQSMARKGELNANSMKDLTIKYAEKWGREMEVQGKIPPGSIYLGRVMSIVAKEMYTFFSTDWKQIKWDYSPR
jgi:hypothetical protein